MNENGRGKGPNENPGRGRRRNSVLVFSICFCLICGLPLLSSFTSKEFPIAGSGTDTVRTHTVSAAASDPGDASKPKDSTRGNKSVFLEKYPGGIDITALSPGIKKFSLSFDRRSANWDIQLAYRGPGAEKWLSFNIPGTTKSLTLTGLKAYRAYETRARIIKTAGNVAFFGPWSPIKTVTTEKDYDDLLILVNRNEGLPEDFVPKNLVDIDGKKLRKEAAEAFSEMKKDAAKAGIHMTVFSGYRSPEYQQETYDYYVRLEGEEKAKRRVAPPGYSEHQTGLAIDVSSGYEWTDENCWKYGFIAPLTEAAAKVTGSRAEPWHIRYLGKEHASAFVKSGILTFSEYYEKYIN